MLKYIYTHIYFLSSIKKWFWIFRDECEIACIWVFWILRGKFLCWLNQQAKHNSFILPSRKQNPVITCWCHINGSPFKDQSWQLVKDFVLWLANHRKVKESRYLLFHIWSVAPKCCHAYTINSIIACTTISSIIIMS